MRIAVSGPVALLAWLAFAVLGALVTAWVLLAVPGEEAQPPRSRSNLDLPGTSVSRTATRVAVGAWLFGAARVGTCAFARDHLTAAGGHSDTTATILWIVLGVTGLAGGAGGDLSTRHGLTRVWRASLAALALATAAIGLLPASLTAAVPAMALFGAAYMTLTIVVFFAALPLDPARPALSGWASS